MKMRVQAQHLQAGDIVGSGEVVVSVQTYLRNEPKKVSVYLKNPNRAVIVPTVVDRVSTWGKYTEINIERPEKVEKEVVSENWSDGMN